MPGVRHTLVPLTIGMRVVIRHSIAGGPRGPWTDSLGELIAQDERVLVVRTRTGDARINRAAVVAAKPIPPPPKRILRP